MQLHLLISFSAFYEDLAILTQYRQERSWLARAYYGQEVEVPKSKATSVTLLGNP